MSFHLLAGSVELKKGRVFQSGMTIHKTFGIGFEVMATAYSAEQYSNMMQATIGGSTGNYGDRIVGIWFEDLGSATNRGLSFGMDINSKTEYFQSSKRYPLHIWILVEIKQVLRDGKYFREISIDSEVIHSLENTNAVNFHNVTIYTSNPWEDPQQGRIKNLHVSTGKLLLFLFLSFFYFFILIV